MTLLQSGDHVVVTDNTYGGTYRLFERVLRKHGLDFTYVDTSDLAALEAAFKPNTRMLFLEIAHQPGAAHHRHRRGLRCWRTRAACPWWSTTRLRARTCSGRSTLGADLVLHSTTKFLNGHSDSIGGIVVATRDDHIEWLRFVQNAEGAILGPMDAWLVLRGTKTLPLRMERHNANAQRIAEFLAGAPRGAPGPLPRPAVAPAARAREAADAGVRRRDRVCAWDRWNARARC